MLLFRRTWPFNMWKPLKNMKNCRVFISASNRLQIKLSYSYSTAPRHTYLSLALLFAKRLCLNDVVQGCKAFQGRKGIQVLQASTFLVLQVTVEPQDIQDPLVSQGLRVHLDHLAGMEYLDFQVSSHFLPADKDQTVVTGGCSLCLGMLP